MLFLSDSRHCSVDSNYRILHNTARKQFVIAERVIYRFFTKLFLFLSRHSHFVHLCRFYGALFNCVNKIFSNVSPFTLVRYHTQHNPPCISTKNKSNTSGFLGSARVGNDARPYQPSLEITPKHNQFHSQNLTGSSRRWCAITSEEGNHNFSQLLFST